MALHKIKVINANNVMPYISNIFQGKIACCNVLSDLYAMGVTECDNMLMLLGVSSKFTEKARDVIVPLMMRGFKVIFSNVVIVFFIF